MKKAVITGASSGLGYGIASKLTGRGVKVVNLSRNECDLEVENVKTDLTKNSDITSAIAKLNGFHKDIDLLVLNAGVLHWRDAGKESAEEVDHDFAVNITGAIKLVNGLIELIKKNEGDIVIIGSTGSFTAEKGSSTYCSAKHAVLGFIRALQAEFKKEGVRIIGFHPGGFRSQLHIKAGSPLRQEDLMDAGDLADLLIHALEAPRSLEVSEIIVNRKMKNL
ncbi:MAG: SDR family oxidoreductase [Candidatus Woesearchaeota archaeon]